MKFLRFLYKELFLNGIIFSIAGTVVLSSLYLISLGVDVQVFFSSFKTFFLGFIGRTDYSNIRAGFTSGQIIFAGAVFTLPLALICLVYILFFSLISASISVSGKYSELFFNKKLIKIIALAIDLVFSLLATIPLFVGFWLSYVVDGNVPLFVIALIAVLAGGLTWDASSFLKNDMMSQIEQTHSIVYSTQGKKIGYCFPIPGSYTWYLFVSCLPRFIPYMAGKIPVIIGAVTIAEIAFDFPGLGKNLIDALIASNTNLLITSVFILLCVNAIVTIIVKFIFFLVFPRWYEKNI